MITARSIVSVAPADPPRLSLRDMSVRSPGRDEVLVEQIASSINPIDVKRAGGYGARLLSLRGAGRFPLVLGNDVLGIVRKRGSGVSGFAVGTMVVGVMPTGPTGAHASRVVVPARWLRPAPVGADVQALAALPYNFTTMWLALRSAGLDASTARGRKVLVNGAAGGLGRMALHVLHEWGAELTAVDSAHLLAVCGELGARQLVARGPQALQQLPADFGAVLNFGSWDDDAQLSARLAIDALGHATTVHPLLATFDAHGWVRGAWRVRGALRAARKRVAARSPAARYSWVVFRPDEEALDRLLAFFTSGLRLPVGWTGTVEDASTGFQRVADGAPGRSVLLLGSPPQGRPSPSGSEHSAKLAAQP